VSARHWRRTQLQRELRTSNEKIEAACQLTSGEREVLDLLMEGHPNKAIATKLNLTYKAVENAARA